MKKIKRLGGMTIDDMQKGHFIAVCVLMFGSMILAGLGLMTMKVHGASGAATWFSTIVLTVFVVSAVATLLVPNDDEEAPSNAPD